MLAACEEDDVCAVVPCLPTTANGRGRACVKELIARDLVNESEYRQIAHEIVLIPVASYRARSWRRKRLGIRCGLLTGTTM